MLQDDFEELMKKFEGADPTKMNLEEAMSEVHRFFSSLKQEILHASPEERESIFANLSQMYTRLSGLTQKMADKLGMTEEQLIKLSEDMRFFSPEQKELIEKTKKQMMADAQDLATSLREGSGEEKISIEKKEESKHKPTTRSKWMRT